MKLFWLVFLRVVVLTAVICQTGVVGALAQSPQIPAVDLNADSPQWVVQPGEMPVDYEQVRTFGEVDVPYLTDTNHINFLTAVVTNPGYLPENQDQFYVVENQGQRMMGYDPGGTNVLEIGTAGLYGLLNDPVDAAVDSNGNLWILTTSLIWVYDPAGNFLFNIPEHPWELPGDDPLRFNWTAGIDFIHNGTGDDKVLISETYQHSVKYFDVDLTTSPYTLTHIETITGGFTYPLKVEAINNRFYLADSTQPPVIWECRLAAPHDCIVFDGGSSGSGDHQLMYANGLAVDETYIYIVDQDNQRVKRCGLASGDCEGNFITSSDSNLIDRPVDVAVNSDGTLLVGSIGSMTVLKFNANGTLFTPNMMVGTPYEPYFVDEFHYYGPAGVEVDAQGNVYIIERQGNRLIKVNELGELQWTFGVAGVEGNDNTHLGWPEGSPAVDSLGRVYLASSGREVYIIESNGGYHGMIYFNEPNPGALGRVCSVAIDAQDDIYVSDCGKNVVKVYGPNHAYKYSIGSESPSSPPPLDDNHFWSPVGIDFLDINTFYLADSYNNRVESCTRPNSTSQFWSCKQFAGIPRVYNAPLQTPVDVAVDSAGKVYVLDVSKAGFFVFTPEGEAFAKIGDGLLSGPDELSYPSSLTIDAQGSVYVADRHNAVVRKYVPVTGTTEFVSQAGGGIIAVAKQGNYAYVAGGAYLHVLDLTTTPPTEVGRSDLLTDTVLDIVISGGYAYAASESGWITIFDLSNTAHPDRVSRFPTNNSAAMDIDVWGTKLYAAAGGSGLLIYDLVDPEYPILLGQMRVHEDITSVALASTISGLTAFVTAKDGGTDGWLCALDVDNAASIILLDELDTPGRAVSLAVQGDLVIVADAGTYGLRMINAATPTALNEFGSLGGYYARRVEISGNYAYFLDQNNLVRSVNISAPSNPILGDTIENNGDSRALLLSGSSLYITDLTNGLRRISISNPNDMIELPGWFNAPGQAEWIFIKNGMVYQAAGRKNLQVIDARNPLNPTVTGQLGLWGKTIFVTVADGYTYTINGDGKMDILNVSAPGNPQLAGTYWDVGVIDVDVYHQRAYVVGNGGLHILDVSNPADVHEIGVFTDPDRLVYHVKVEENESGQVMAYLLMSEVIDNGWPDSLQVLDVTDPSDIIVYDWVGTEFSEGFDVLNGIVYIAGNVMWGNNIFIINATNPAAMDDLGGYSQGSMAVRNVVVSMLGGRLYAYISTYQNGMLVADVSDPANPFLVGNIDLPGDVRNISVEGNLVAAAGGEAGLLLTWFASQTIDVVGNNDILITQSDAVVYTFAADSLEDQLRLIHNPIYEGATPDAPSGLAGIGHAFTVTGLDYRNDRKAGPINPYTLEISYTQSDLGRIKESTLKLYYCHDGTNWVEETSTLNQSLNTITAYPDHFSIWRVFGVSYNWVYLPTVMR